MTKDRTSAHPAAGIPSNLDPEAVSSVLITITKPKELWHVHAVRLGSEGDLVDDWWVALELLCWCFSLASLTQLVLWFLAWAGTCDWASGDCLQLRIPRTGWFAGSWLFPIVAASYTSRLTNVALLLCPAVVPP